MQHVSPPWDKSNQTTFWCTNNTCNQSATAGFIRCEQHTGSNDSASSHKWGQKNSIWQFPLFIHFHLSFYLLSSALFLLPIPTCSHSPGVPGCTEAAPCPGAPGGPAACAVRRVTRGPGLGWSDAGGTDLHPWVPHTGDSTLSHQHTANQQHQAEPRTRRDEAKSRVAKRGTERCYGAKTQWGETGQDGKDTGMKGGGEAVADLQFQQWETDFFF